MGESTPKTFRCNRCEVEEEACPGAWKTSWARLNGCIRYRRGGGVSPRGKGCSYSAGMRR